MDDLHIEDNVGDSLWVKVHGPGLVGFTSNGAELDDNQVDELIDFLTRYRNNLD